MNKGVYGDGLIDWWRKVEVVQTIHKFSHCTVDYMHES